MYKRLIAFPLCIIFCIAVFSFPAFAIVYGDPPENVLSFSYRPTVSFNNGSITHTSPLSFVGGAPFSAGSLYRAAIYGDGVSQSYTFSINTTVSYFETISFYIAIDLNSYMQNMLDWSELSSYYVSDDDNIRVDSAVYDTRIYKFNSDFLTPTIVNQGSYTTGVAYVYFENVPAKNSFNVYWLNGSTASTGFANYYFGWFINTTSQTIDNILGSYENGDMSYSDALKDLNYVIQDAVASAPTYDQAILETLIGQNKIEQLIQLSNDKNLTHVNTVLVPSLNNTVNSFTSGNVSLQDSLTSLNSSFGSSLESAETPEQALLVTTQYQIALKKLELQAQIQAKNRLDDVISDDEMSQFDDYYATEQEIVDRFDVAEFESQLDYERWILQLPTYEAMQYRQFFEYILNDSKWRYFILIPMIMTLVSVVLGTRIRLRGGDPGSHSDPFVREYSGKWDSQNRGS